MSIKTAYLETRSQSAKGKWPRQGPDTYVVVQVVPKGVERLEVLNKLVAAKRGIELLHIGEGYYKNQGPRSALGAAIRLGQKTVDEINSYSVLCDKLLKEMTTKDA